MPPLGYTVSKNSFPVGLCPLCNQVGFQPELSLGTRQAATRHAAALGLPSMHPNSGLIMISRTLSAIQRHRLVALPVVCLDTLQPVAALAARLYVAQAFFLSGLTKLRDWDTTLALFTDEYKVPWLSPSWAAVLGTGGELALPVLLALGLATRFAALGLSVVNVVAVIALGEIAAAALQQHQFWGALLIGVAVYGPGRVSLDRLAASWVLPPSRDNIGSARH